MTIVDFDEVMNEQATMHQYWYSSRRNVRWIMQLKKTIKAEYYYIEILISYSDKM